MMTETAQAEAPIVDLEEKAGVFDPNDSWLCDSDSMDGLICYYFHFNPMKPVNG